MATKRSRDADVAKQRRTLCVRFKRIVRSVIMNQQWLGDAEEHGLSTNVKKKVAILLRTKRKIGMLTAAEKALLRTQPRSRTIEERKRLCMIIGNLTCFAKIPPKIRARMVPVLKFMTIHADRFLIKEGDPPITVYFIITGEVEMKKSIYNKKTKEVTWVSEAIFGPGDCIGDVEKVEDCPRMNTFVTMTNCEILAIFENDYNSILGPFMTKQWNEKKEALRSLDYFEFLNDQQRIRACKFGSLVQYEPLETIYYEDKGSVSYVHFILSGECVILQCLNMLVNKKEGRTSFELIDTNKGGSVMFPSDAKHGSLPSTLSGYTTGANADIDIQEILASSVSEDKETKQKDKAMRKMSLKEIEAYCGISKSIGTIKKPKKHKTIKLVTQYQQRPQQHKSKGRHKRMNEEHCEEEDMELDFENDEEGMMDDDYYYNYFDEEYYEDIEEEGKVESRSTMKMRSIHSIARSRSAILSRKISTVEMVGEDSDSESEIFTLSNSDSSQSSSRQFELEIRPPSHRMETHFIDVGSLTYGGIFGLGEKMEHRVIMSRTVVQCLLLPRFWLMEEEQNPGHIWQLRRFYFECNVPARSELFANYLKTRRWNKFRHQYVQSCLTPSAAMGNTKEEDIPIVSRIVETSDD